MSFKTQKLVNNFPEWTKVRRDPSSVGHRVMSVFGDILELDTIENIKLSERKHILKRWIEAGEVWSVALDEADEIQPATSIGGARTYTYPTTVTGDGNTLIREEFMEDLLYGVPGRISSDGTASFTDLEVWSSSASSTYNDIDHAEYLWVIVENSTEYKKRTRNPSFSGRSIVYLEGEDENGIKIEEWISVRDDDVYRTRNIFSKLTNVEWDGFDGDVTIKSAGTNLPHEVDRWRPAYTQKVSGPLRLSMSTTNVGGTDYSILEYRVNDIKRGEEYRFGEEIPHNTVNIDDQVLKDDGSVAYTYVDFAINPYDTRLYVLDDAGKVHIYDHGLTPFGVPPETANKDTLITIQPVQHYIELGTTMKLFTWLQRPHEKILHVQIKRISPSDTTEYLQGDLTWSVTQHTFPGDPEESLVPATWDDKFFDSTFDETGTWDFFAITTDDNGDKTTAHTAVMVDELDAISSLDTSVTAADGLFFDKNGTLTVSKDTTLHYFQLHHDAYVADPERQQLYFKEEYSSIEVTY